MTVTVNTPPDTSPPDKFGGDPVAFDAAMQAHLGWHTTAIAQMNLQNAENNAINANVNAQTLLATAAGAAAVAAANFKGNWADLTGALTVPASVLHNGQLWQLTANLANVTTATPGVSASWFPVSNLDRADRAPIAPSLDLDFERQRYRVYDGAVGLKSIALADVMTYTGSGRTYTDAMGILKAQGSNVPRVAFDAATGAGRGLSVWAARTNLALRSQEFANASWTKTNATVVDNTTTAPDGTSTASTFTATAALAQVQQVPTGTLGVEHTASVYIKRKTGTGAVYLRSVENVNTLVTVTDQWTRIEKPTTSSSTSLRIGVVLATSGDEVYLWGAQMEVGGTASPYIPTTTASVTAPADVANITSTNFSKWFNATEGTLVVLYRTGELTAATRYAWGLSDGSTNNCIGRRVGTSSTRDVAVVVAGSTVVNSADISALSLGALDACAVAWGAGSLALSNAGGAVETVAMASTPAITQLQIGGLASGSTLYLNGTVARVLYFPRTLPNHLQALSA